MTQPTLKLTWRHLDPSAALTALVDEEVDALSKLFRDPVRCDVTIERSDRFGAPACRVRAVLETRGATLVSDHMPAPDEDADAYGEVRDAFKSLRRQLTRHLQRTAPRSGPKLASVLPR